VYIAHGYITSSTVSSQTYYVLAPQTTYTTGLYLYSPQLEVITTASSTFVLFTAIEAAASKFY
jgi:hypothetical protein